MRVPKMRDPKMRDPRMRIKCVLPKLIFFDYDNRYNNCNPPLVMANIDEKDNSNCDNELDNLDKAFSTISLVNATDMDVYLKAIMLMDEKTAQNLRGKLNHVAAEFIDADPALKKLIEKNNYLNFNIKYLSENYYKTRDAQIQLNKTKLKYHILELINLTGSFSNTFRILNKYVKGLKNVSENNLTIEYSAINGKFVKECCEDGYKKIITNIHFRLYRLFTLLDHTYDSKSLMISRINTYPVLNHVTKALKSITIFFIREDKRVSLNINMRKLTDIQIMDLIRYFNNCEISGLGCMEFCDTLLYVDSDEDDLNMLYNHEETVKLARS